MDPTPEKPNLREIDVEDLTYIRSVLSGFRTFAKRSDSVPDINKCKGPLKPAESLWMKYLKESIREVGASAHTSEKQLKTMNAALFRMFLEDTELQTTTDETDDVDSDSETKPCEVCMKDDGHLPDDCPYLDYVPDPENTPLGKRYHIVCLDCCKLKEDHGHPAGTWFGRASLNLVEKGCFLRKPSEKSTDEKPAQPTDKSDEGDNDLDDLYWKDADFNDLDWA